jgi:hypothetical protein
MFRFRVAIIRESFRAKEYKPNTPIIRRMRFACWITKATDKHALRICNAYCFSTATVVTRTRFNVTFVRTPHILLKIKGDGIQPIKRTKLIINKLKIMYIKYIRCHMIDVTLNEVPFAVPFVKKWDII